MVPTPIALAFLLCEKIVIEERTRRLTFVNSFTKLELQQLPSPPPAFMVFAALTDGLGDATIALTVSRQDRLDEIYLTSRAIRFPDRLVEMQMFFQIGDCAFPVAGNYRFTLFVDGEAVAQRRLRIFTERASS